MKRNFFLTMFILICTTSCITITAYKEMNPSAKKQLRSYKLAEANIKGEDFLSQKSKTPQIYRLDSLQFAKIAASTGQKQVLLVAYNCWCAASTEVFDSIISAVDTNNVALCLISTDDYSFRKKTAEYLLSHNYFYSTFMLDLELYGSGLNFNNKFLNFAKQMFPNITLNAGLNSYILLSPTMQVVSYGNVRELWSNTTVK
ncbi:MAG: hypothetical protein LBO06_04710 [Bacteroidales bacterium]|jgi:hypothetical protein|nr:hypothetical protein [Bacteroidales bacterium]